MNWLQRLLGIPPVRPPQPRPIDLPEIDEPPAQRIDGTDRQTLERKQREQERELARLSAMVRARTGRDP